MKWLAFDTEFIGEKRYYTLLCLIQVKCETGTYLLDSLKIPDLTPFLRLIEDERITKITHAGDNDYRLLNILYGTIPKNIFDTQIAAGFIGYRYPMSFGKLVEAETGEILDPELVFEFNHWLDLWLDPVLGWREFIHWVWRKIVAWWKSLWD